ncbi:MAG: phosphodiester glycosidase family protein [Capsulimonas sp.]|uniref:phosphodiester glycosidase family protein n=1 Tax=Capsulimonas sp. TaxID=2494211 RepID=UPI003265B421
MKFQRRAASVALCLLAASSLCAVSASGKSQSASDSHHHNTKHKAAPASPAQASHKNALAKRLAAKQQAAREKKHALLAKQNALHAKRLATKQKAAWRAHVAKVRELSPKERRALRQHNNRLAQLKTDNEERRTALAKHNKRVALLAASQKKASHKTAAAKKGLTREARAAKSAHDRRLAAKQAAMDHSDSISKNLKARRQAATLAAQHQKWVAQQDLRARRQAAEQATHERKARITLAAYENTARDRQTTKAASAHDRRLAAQQVERNRKLALQHAEVNRKQADQRAEVNRKQALRQAEAQRKLAIRQAAYAKKMAAHNARLIRAQALHQSRLAAHNARVAAKRSHYVATHGDDTGGRSIRFWQTNVAKVPVKVITVDLNDPNVKVSAVMARNGNGTSEPFRQMIDRANPNVAVTGTFFSLDNLRPVGDIVIGGSLVHFGGMGTALCVTPGNKADMVSCQWGRHHDWSDYDFVCACGPRLLQKGRIVLDPHSERFRDKSMLAPNSRIAVGITSSNKLVFAMTRDAIYLGRLARVMRGLGCVEAMNLDAGTSTGFYYNGTTLARPGRKLTNMIVVYGRKDRYERALDQLVPPPYRRTGSSVSPQNPSVLALK